MKTTTRRQFLLGSTAWAATHALRAADAPKLKAAIIGHTGAGDYGHGIERIFAGLPNVSVVAVADPNDAGRAKAKAACGAARDYADYSAMLGKEKPDLVAIGPRWATEHHAMSMAALEAGAHLYLEKPFTITLAEADDIVQLAKGKQRRVAVAHVTRMAPAVLRLEKALREGLIGDVLEIHTVGKMGSRAGGQDMMVLGLHVFDLARLFGGEVQWCQARMRHQGKVPTIADAKESPSDKVGPVVGDDIFASFAMDSGVNVTFRSRVGLEKAAGPFGMEIIGTRGIVRLNSGFAPGISLLKEPNRAATTRAENWQDWTGGVDPATETTYEGLTGYDASHRRVVRDWLNAIDEKREPLGSGERAMKAIEMAHGVFQAGITGARVEFPLVKRTHPLVA
ncbi:Gfo/Idh/MocA family oxidoreductase [Prosthecobacter sp.]|uniref:Gfo/Idh/MocA family protein n=1 Tax=Prosthecobacter sp. TaxID=1965333 RepID=UPI002ABAC5F6|nr:Gfo/Idh/MocA family oxidoreductase [Prosthecobacter sp.]MDZ4403062.1 Gfo/Idh/MocA family oxidoreductase [Prosthecobacter sp.]